MSRAHGRGEKVARWTAVALFAAGLIVALVVGAWAVGALVFSSGVVFLGVGSLREDWAVGLAMVAVGLAAIVGVLGHMLTGVGI
ncbi:Hypothetical Protein RradSPS_2044 [Rubrobacter radiotolerans]|uniref:Uncharacterized protein n=1 Tax=Rubrobacter radiotolerans TaxID=42256 RepID=A0A023X4C9_RUBRA|nr:hypothetical protein [Rubrobacter radiotolerans]AHY47327.1 Hypothetical Protein RradSPS_2044 [Rubrobacter radiotolerans]MDX5894731.1 hypothetical protein [Rubrobacter radiotolerans]SMC06630.1 conserved hypothetical protein [Rubrobacter radiotolerans DSM 5868]